MSEHHKHGLKWAAKMEPKVPPTWCTKEKPCDYDKNADYCPQRECQLNRHLSSADSGK